MENNIVNKMQLYLEDVENPLGIMSISDHEFTEIRKMVYDNLGIHLTKEKRSLVVGRLQKIVRSHGCSSFKSYLEYIRSDNSGKALSELANSISTNYTYFFREKVHIDFFVKMVLPEAIKRAQQNNSNRLRFWCAGCSHGDEPYSYVMAMMEYFQDKYDLWDAGILATDISGKALQTARKGVYPEDRIKMVPEMFRFRYLKKLSNGMWEVSERVKREVTFRRFNLMNSIFPFKNSFDMISCRNVMIYFDTPTRDALVERFYEWTLPGGYLFIGHSETIPSHVTNYNKIQPAIFRKELQ